MRTTVTRRHAPARVESLEFRVMLAGEPAPLGPEVRVHPVAAGQQMIGVINPDSIAADAAGNYIVVWREDDYTIWYRRFAASGAPTFGPTRVAAAARGTSESPVVAMNGRGEFVVVWTSEIAPGGVLAQRFGATGAALSDAIRVNPGSNGTGPDPRVAMDEQGNFVAVWVQSTDLVSQLDIYARRFNAAGQPLGNSFLANAYTNTVQASPDVATDAAGNFVVSWLGAGPDTNGAWAQRFDAAGQRVGGQFALGDPPSGGGSPRVAMDADGDFAAVYTVARGPTVDVTVRRFDRTGAPQGAPFLANQLPGGHGHPAIDMAPDGRFVVAWERTGDGTSDLFARSFDPSGAPRGGEFAVNSSVTAGQDNLLGGVAVGDAGNFAAAWMSVPDPFVDYDVYARAFAASTATVVARHVFYNHSVWDGNDEAADARDDNAIVTNKTALLPGQAATFANVTTFDRGLNGIMVDIANLPAGSALGPDDFEIGGDGTRVMAVNVRRGAGVNGSDRVTLTWPDYNTPTDPPAIAVGNGWLRVTVKANANTGLPSPDTFSYGNLIGESGDAGGTLGWRVNALDLAAVKRALNAPTSFTSPTDFNRDGRTNALDLAIVRRQLGMTLGPPPGFLEMQRRTSERSWVSGVLA